MRKKTLNLLSYINPAIEVGDTVRFKDGSSLSCPDHNDQDFYIVHAYPNFTGSSLNLKEMLGKVVETGVTDKIIVGAVDNAYVQDIAVQLGDAIFRTSSKMVEFVPQRLTVNVELSFTQIKGYKTPEQMIALFNDIFGNGSVETETEPTFNLK